MGPRCALLYVSVKAPPDLPCAARLACPGQRPSAAASTIVGGIMDKAAIDTWAPRSRPPALDGIAWDEPRRTPLGAATVRTLRYMQDIESHTIIYVRQLLATRAIDDPDVATFLARGFYEETFHGRALARLLAAAGESTVERQRSRQPWLMHVEDQVLALVSRVWPDFVGVHMTWGAINELTTL